ncbi:hypothetical protein GTW71_28215 [Streptomyces sp. SID6041]|nr:hypothetical protein [Streptomyces sp. SID6041]
MQPEKAARPTEPEGCLTVAVRIPVRIVVLVLVVPLRLGRDALVLSGAFLRRALRPLGRALDRFGAHVLVPVARAVVLPAPSSAANSSTRSPSPGASPDTSPAPSAASCGCSPTT